MGERLLLEILSALLKEFGAALVRQKVDEWEAAREASDVAFRAKFPGEEPSR